MPPKKKQKQEAGDTYKPKNILVTGGAGFMYVFPLASFLRGRRC
jgi:hypothetical protein